MKQQFELEALIPASKSSQFILCFYINSTNYLQIIRIANIPHWSFERVVFTGQRLLFEAPPDAILEIHTHEATTAILADKVRCSYLKIQEEVEMCIPATTST